MFPAASRPFQRATTLPPGCGRTTQAAHDVPAGGDDLRSHRAARVDAEAHLGRAEARCGAARREQRAVMAVEPAAVVIRRRVDADRLDRRPLELEHLGEAERSCRSGEQSPRECDRDCALHRADRTRSDARALCRRSEAVGLDARGAVRSRLVGLDGAAERLVDAEARVVAEHVLERAAEAFADRGGCRGGLRGRARAGAGAGAGAAWGTGCGAGWSRGRNSGQSTIEASSKPGGRQTGRTMLSSSGPRTCRP